MRITNLVDFNRLYSILRKYLEIELDQKVTQGIKRYFIEDIYNFFKKIISEDKDLKNDSIFSKYKFLHDIIELQSEKIASLMMFLLIRNEKIIKGTDISISVKNVLMYINKELNRLFDMESSYTLLVRNNNIIHVIGWHNHKETAITSQKIRSKYIERTEDKLVLGEKDYYIYTSALVNCDYSISFLFLKELNFNEKVLLDVIFASICEFYSMHLPIIIGRNPLNERKIFSRDLYFNLQEYHQNNDLILDPSFKETKLNILHLSDLHYTNQTKDNNSTDFLDKFYGTKVISLDSKNKIAKERIDLIVITGDVIFAGKSTKTIYRNYLQALINIEIIAAHLLGNIWQDRLIIIPGNHDYGMINEVKVDMLGRSYNYSDIDTDASNEQEKFVFFRLLFDGIMKENDSILFKPIKKFDVISYEIIDTDRVENQTIQFLVFNTAKHSNAIISNKTTLDLEEKDFKKVKTNIPTLMLMHHTPLFNLNYYRDIFSSFEDNYLSFLYGSKDEEISLIDNIFNMEKKIEKLEEEKESDVEKQEYNNQLAIILQAINKNNEELRNKYIIPSNNKDEKANAIFDKNEELKMYLEENNANDEFFLNKKYTFSLLFSQSIKDKEIYQKSINILIKIFKKILILGGHEHKQYVGMFDNFKIFEVGRPNYFGILELKLDNTDYFSSEYYSSVSMIETTEKSICEENGKIFIEVPKKEDKS